MTRTEYSHKPVREPFINFNGTLLPLYKCTTRFIYECYVQMKCVTPTSVLKWKTLHEDFYMSEEEWTDVFLRPYICLRETKLQSFQYKIIHRIINCNKKLFDMRIKNSPLCTYCDQTDDIGHFFFLCISQQYWMLSKYRCVYPISVHKIISATVAAIMFIGQMSEWWCETMPCVVSVRSLGPISI